MDLRLTHFRHFLLVAETKSFGRAAKRAFRSQPALSQSIRQLEAHLGQPLFEKRSRTTLTPFGEMCLPLVLELVTQADHATNTMQQVAQVAGGRMTIGLTPSVATHLLPSLLPAFVKRYPAVQVKMYVEDSHKIYDLVMQGAVDIAVSSLQRSDPGIVFTPLIQDRFGLLCRSNHALANLGRPVRWEELRDQPILGHYAHDLLVDTSVWTFVGEPRIHLSNLPTLFSLVENGLGITPIPALAAPTTSPVLTFVPLVKPVEARTIGIMAAAGRSLLPAARSFVDLLHTQLSEVQWTHLKPFVKLMVRRAGSKS